jgi:meromycolic acid enoyl-[acyl-carrier-protein] reductase
MTAPVAPGDAPAAGGMLEGKRLLITGVVTTDSIAFASAAAAMHAGAEVVLSALGRDRERAEGAAARLPGTVAVLEADLTEPDHLTALAAELARRWGRLDGALHAVAFAPRAALAGEFLDTEIDAVSRAFHASTHSYASLARLVAELAPDRGGAIVGLDFDAVAPGPSTTGWASAKRGSKR